MVHVVGADAGTKHSLEEIVLLVGAFGGLEDRERIGSARVAQPHQLLGRQLHGLVPRRFAERRIPLGRCRSAIARIAKRRTTRRGRLQWIRARPSFRVALVLHVEPWTTAAWPQRAIVASCRDRFVVHPPTVLLFPAASDQRHRQAIAMLCEVVSETTLHARRALIRRILFDPR